MENKRSVGVTIASGVNLVIGLLWFKEFILLVIGILKEPFPRGETWRLGLGIGLLVVTCTFSLCFIRLGILTYKLIPRARLYNIQVAVLGITVCGFFVLVGNLLIASSRIPLETYIYWILWTVYFIWLLIYFTRPKVKEQFKRE